MMSGYDADTSSESECSTSALLDYDLIRLRKMQRNYELLKRLGLVTPTTPTTIHATSPHHDGLQPAQNSATSPTLFNWHDHNRRPASSLFFAKKSPPKRQTLKSKTTRDFLVNRKSARLSRKPRVSYSEFHRNRFDSQESLSLLTSSKNDDQPGQPETAILASPDSSTPIPTTMPDNNNVIGSRRRPAGVFVQGSRVYDPVNGITCHQCRQKTIEKKTRCSRCHKGHICSRCLQNRYGEVFEQALQNPNWTCPQCRGICNCSTCLNKQGRSAVGMLIAEVHDRGYNSVAEMLAAQPGSHYRHIRVAPQPSSATSTTELDIDADDEASDYFKSKPTPNG